MEETFQATQWVRRGGMLTNRDFLNLTDPESWVSLWKAQFGDLFDFPWDEFYGREPTTKELYEAGVKACPCCNQMLQKDWLNDN